ncbi:hypothetical protein OUZ56_018358 [Daphnia magna]|uniref:THAP-type domain-containing protein n=1 Tax=Daphnia magna TaxID=35525 RepID=A0ABQ9Z8M0_9CRUS|nr:hypothetical protein OUZ56_018358 [Daphnia magna]
MAVGKPKRIYCFICGSVQENEREKFALFCVPKGKLEEWTVAIVPGQKSSLRKPLQTLNGQNLRVLEKKKSLKITTKVPHTTKDNENVVPINHCSTNSNLGCGSNLMLTQPETECLREDQRDGSCMVMDDSVDSVTVVPISHSSTLSKTKCLHAAINDVSECLGTDQSDGSCMFIEETKDTAMMYSPSKENDNVATSSQLSPKTKCQATYQNESSITVSERTSVSTTTVSNIPSCPIYFSPFAVSPERKEEIRKSWDILFGYIPGLRNTLEYVGSFSRRQAAIVSKEDNASSPSSSFCEKTTTREEKQLQRRKKNLISCCSCNAPVSATNMRTRHTNRVCCGSCYPLWKKLEESERRIELLKLKYKKLRNKQKSTKKKLDRSYQKNEELRSKLEKCEDKIVELTKLQIDEQIKHLPLKNKR